MTPTFVLAPQFVVTLSYPGAFHESVLVTSNRDDALRVFSALADAGPDRRVALCYYDEAHGGAILRSFGGHWFALSPDRLPVVVAVAA